MFVTFDNIDNCETKGLCCSFLKIDGIGYKFYESRYVRDNAYRYQKLAASEKLAPDVYDIGEISVKHDGRNFTFYYYTTEIVRTLDDKRRYPNKQEFTELIDGLEKLGIPGEIIDDMHTGNIGYLKDNSLVCIDFS